MTSGSRGSSSGTAGISRSTGQSLARGEDMIAACRLLGLDLKDASVAIQGFGALAGGQLAQGAVSQRGDRAGFSRRKFAIPFGPRQPGEERSERVISLFHLVVLPGSQTAGADSGKLCTPGVSQGALCVDGRLIPAPGAVPDNREVAPAGTGAARSHVPCRH